MDGLDRVLGLSALLLEALLSIESTAFSGFGLFGGVSFHGGHGEILRTVWVILLDSKETMSHLRRIWLMANGLIRLEAVTWEALENE